MATKHDLEDWVCESLRNLGDSGRLIDVAKQIWGNHQSDLISSGDLFYTWQYDMRWAANRLRRSGKMKAVETSPSGVWELK